MEIRSPIKHTSQEQGAKVLHLHDSLVKEEKISKVLLCWGFFLNRFFMVNPKQPGHIVTLITLDTLYFLTELVSSHLHMKTQSTWATRLNTSPQFPSNKIHFGVPTTLEGKSHSEWETFPCIDQSQSHFHLNCAFGDMTLVLHPLTYRLHHLNTRTFLTFPKNTHIHITSFFQKTLNLKQLFQPTKNDSSKNYPWFFWNISQFVGNFEHLELRKKNKNDWELIPR